MSTESKLKSLDDIKRDMSALYDEVRNGTTDLKMAAELSNIAGKHLKAEQLQLAREIFQNHLGRNVNASTNELNGTESIGTEVVLHN